MARLVAAKHRKKKLDAADRGPSIKF